MFAARYIVIEPLELYAWLKMCWCVLQKLIFTKTFFFFQEVKILFSKKKSCKKNEGFSFDFHLDFNFLNS